MSFKKNKILFKLYYLVFNVKLLLINMNHVKFLFWKVYRHKKFEKNFSYLLM